VGRITLDGKLKEFPIPSRDSQPRAMATHPDGSIWFVETSTNALGRLDRDGNITEYPVPTPNASLRGVTVGPDDNLWYTANFANKIGCMTPSGTVLGEYDIPTVGSGPRSIATFSDGRMFFSQYDAGLIGEIALR
jgi:virginiamycin B lyase